MNQKAKVNPWIGVAAVAFGYFVDLYDLLLFSSIRVASLKELGYTGAVATEYTAQLMNWTVGGMIIGGFVWGMFADKKGRLSVLFISIMTYTAANFFNAFIQDIQTYKICRLFAGFGLAGELGVGLTLISETLAKQQRTKAAMIVSGFGMVGAVFAGVLTNQLAGQTILGISSWRFLFLLGGVLGLCVLIARARILESSMFQAVQQKSTQGNMLFLLSKRDRRLRFLWCVLAGLPIFFIIGVFITLSPEYGKLSGLNSIKASTAVIWCYGSISFFDFVGTWLSKILKSRKQVLYIFLAAQAIAIFAFLYIPSDSELDFYKRCAFLGMSIGGWGVLIINSVEQFGTNLRATVSTAVPNLIRGALFPLQQYLFKPLQPQFGIVHSAALVSAFALLVAFIAIYNLKETFEIEMDFEEENSQNAKVLAYEKPVCP